MLKRHKDILRSIVSDLRDTLTGRYDPAGECVRGDLDRELERLGISLGAGVTPVDALGTPTELERRAHQVAETQLLSVPQKDRKALRAELVERAAYSWINRLLALRAMEARGLIDETLRANPDYQGVSEALFVLRQTEASRASGPDGGWWAVVEDACRIQSAYLPGLFDLADPTVALRPSTATLLKCVGVIGSAPGGFSLDEADAAFADPDAIGWAYQFYQERAKAQVYTKLGSGGKVSTRAEIAAATQLFTEPYMVNWLLQNSLGRSYHEMFPGSKLPEKWEYYIKPEKLEQPAYMGLASLTVMDPCCGSGHFLRVAFDMLVDMYREQHPNFTAEQIADQVLQTHLHGIDIDPRAAQLAVLTLYLRAWEMVRDEHRAKRKAGTATHKPKRINIASTPTGLTEGALERHLRRHPEDRIIKPVLEGIFAALEQADILGSLLRPGEHLAAAITALQKPHNMQLDFESTDSSDLRKAVTALARQDPAELKRMLLERIGKSFSAEAGSTNDVAASLFGHEAEQGVRLLQLLDERYGVVVTNPPYMGSKNMSDVLKNYVERYYSMGKRDLATVFMLRCLELCASSGRFAMIPQQSWMFLHSFQELRAAIDEKSEATSKSRSFRGILRETCLEVLAHLGRYAFSEIDVPIPSVMFVARNQIPSVGHQFWSCRIVARRAAEEQAKLLVKAAQGLNPGSIHHSIQSTIVAIPGSPVVYWLTPRMVDQLSSSSNITSGANPISYIRMGLSTKNDTRFLRFIWEVNRVDQDWKLFAKGGGYQKWVGLQKHVINWRADGSLIKHYVMERYPYLRGN